MSAFKPAVKAHASALQALDNFTPDQMKLITDTVAKDATPDELKLFLYRCKNLGLDPLKPGQIHFVKYGNSPGIIVVGIEGFRSIAHRTGLIAGVARGVTLDKDGKLISGWCEVHRKDWTNPAREEVPFAEYNTGKGPWQKMPQTMLKKVAEAAALRMAFPDILGGVYAQEEMDQADTKPKDQTSAFANGGAGITQTEDGDGAAFEFQEYKVEFGKWKGRSLEEIYRNFGPDQMAGYVHWLEEDAEKKGKTIDPNGTVGVFIKQVEQFLGAMENAPLEGEVVS